MARILIVDDEETIRKLLTNSIQRKGHEVVAVEDGYRACDVLVNFQPDVIVSDIKMPRMTGFQMWEAMKEKHKTLPPIIFITGHGEKSAAIESLRKGAYDYLEKPFDMDEFSHSLESALRKQVLEKENVKLAENLAKANEKLQERLEARTELVHRIQKDGEKTNYSLNMLGTAPSIQSARDTIKRLTENPLGGDVSVLVTGPSGSGKEVVARMIHELSSRVKGPFVPVNCGALPEHLVESELFGHEKGAFTGANARHAGVFEMADGGTLFLDEIGELPLPMQTKLLRALQEKTFRRVGGTVEIKVDVRVIAATNKNLQKAIEDKTFREDLFYRLNTLPIQLPALKDRKEDTITFARVLLKDCTKGTAGAPQDFSQEAQERLLSYDWPGNIRELKSVVHRAALLANGPMVSIDAVSNALGVSYATPLRKPALSLAAGGGGSPVQTAAPSTGGLAYHKWKKDYMHSMEKDYLRQQLLHFHGNVSAIARSMKVSRPNLCRLLKKHDLIAEEFRSTESDAQTYKQAA